MPRWELFSDILKLGVPGWINIAITNLSVAALTGIAGQLGPEAALGYAMGARLEYIPQPVAFGFGTAIVAMVGTNWGACQFRRAREIAWGGAATVALLCGAIGATVAIHPALWIALFSDNENVARIGALYLHIVGPAYLFFGLGLGLFYVTQGLGRGVAAMTANAIRMVASASVGPVAIYGLDPGSPGVYRGCRRILRLRAATRRHCDQRENTRHRASARGCTSCVVFRPRAASPVRATRLSIALPSKGRRHP
jgi:Na+-driven multidrug efflux pump